MANISEQIIYFKNGFITYFTGQGFTVANKSCNMVVYAMVERSRGLQSLSALLSKSEQVNLNDLGGR